MADSKTVKEMKKLVFNKLSSKEKGDKIMNRLTKRLAILKITKTKC